MPKMEKFAVWQNEKSVNVSVEFMLLIACISSILEERSSTTLITIYLLSFQLSRAPFEERAEVSAPPLFFVKRDEWNQKTLLNPSSPLLLTQYYSLFLCFFLVDTSESESCDEKSPASSHCNGFLGAVFKNIEHQLSLTLDTNNDALWQL